MLKLLYSAAGYVLLFNHGHNHTRSYHMNNNNNNNPVPPILVANFGGGVDSTAMLIELVAQGRRPDYILFADTGAEHPETYTHIAYFSQWLVAQGFPAVTTVRRYGADGQYGEKSRASKTGPGYTDIVGNCHQNKTLPSLAFGMKSCSLKWKAEPMDKWLKTRYGNRPIHKLIGYDAGPADSRRAVNRNTDGGQFTYEYPLRTWGWDREACEARIAAAGVKVPRKSACYFCPASKKWEVAQLAINHPKLFAEAIAVELGARHAGPGGICQARSTVKGLGRNWAWSSFAG